MIISVTQTSSNIAEKFDVSFDHKFVYTGSLGSVSRFQNIELKNSDKSVNIQGEYYYSHWSNYVPLRYLFGKVNLTNGCSISRNGKPFGKFVFLHHGFYKSYYEIKTADNRSIKAYSISKSSFNYVPIYSGEEQIALLEVYLTVTDYKYQYKMYLLDKYADLKDLLSIFILYYANKLFTKRFHMSNGTVSAKAWTFSMYNNKFEPEWRENNFPDENFWGKTHLFS